AFSAGNAAAERSAVVAAMSAPSAARREMAADGFKPGMDELPDPHPLSRLQVQALAWFHVERVIPSIDVADGQDAVVLGGVVAGSLRSQRVVTVLDAPAARVADEELSVQLAHG